MQCYISPNLMKKQTHLHLRWPFFIKCIITLSIEQQPMFCLLIIVVFSLSDIKEHLMVYGARSNGDLSGESVDPGCDSDHPVQHDTDQGETRTSDKNSLLPDLWPWAHANLLCYSRTHSNHLTSFTRSLKFYIRSVNIFSPGSPVNRAGFYIQSIMEPFHSVLPCEKKQHRLFMHGFIDFPCFRINTSTRTAWLP